MTNQERPRAATQGWRSRRLPGYALWRSALLATLLFACAGSRAGDANANRNLEIEHVERARELAARGDFAEAERVARAAWMRQCELEGAGRPAPRATAQLVARVVAAQGRHAEAATLLDAVVGAWEDEGSDVEGRFECTLALAAELEAAGRVREARDVLVELDLEVDATEELSASEHDAWHARIRALYPADLRETPNTYF